MTPSRPSRRPSLPLLFALAACAALGLALALAGCSSGPPELARAGDQTITVADFEDAARGNAMQYQGSADSAKAQLLDDLIKRALLISQAKTLHLIPDTALARLRNSVTDRLIVEGLLQKLVPADVPVSDAELRQLYQWRSQEAHLWLIYALDKSQAEEASKELHAGKAFADVASQINSPAILPANGDVQFHAAGEMVSPLDDWIRDAKVNEIQGPLAAPGTGWFVGKVSERRPHSQGSFEMERTNLRQMLHQKKSMAMQAKAFTDLRDQYHVAVEDHAAQEIYQRMTALRAAQSAPGMRPPPPVATDADRQAVLAHYDGEGGKPATYTMADAIADLTNPMTRAPDLQNTAILRQWVENQAVQKCLLLEARRRHVADDPATARRIREQLDNALLQQIYQRTIATRVAAPNDAETRAIYEKHKDQLSQVESARVRLVTLADSSAAAALAAGAAQSKSLKDAAAKTPGAKIEEKDIHYPTKEPMWQMMRMMIQQLQGEAVAGPYHLPTGWTFIQVISKQQTTPAFEQLEPAQRSALGQEALEAEREKTLATYTDSLRKALKVEIHQDQLKKIPWPVPAVAGTPS